LETSKVEAEDAKVGIRNARKDAILKSKTRKDGTSEDICKCRRRSKP
jgi:ribosome recycling factor